jgi:hypothetical protein
VAEKRWKSIRQSIRHYSFFLHMAFVINVISLPPLLSSLGNYILAAILYCGIRAVKPRISAMENKRKPSKVLGTIIKILMIAKLTIAIIH